MIMIIFIKSFPVVIKYKYVIVAAGRGTEHHKKRKKRAIENEKYGEERYTATDRPTGKRRKRKP